MDRKSFIHKSFLGSMAAGYSGMVMSNSFNSPGDANSRPSDLKITDIRGARLAAIYDFPIIKIYTNQGIIGLGEVRDAGWLAQALMLKPYLIGKDPLDIETILLSIRHLTGPGRYGGGYSAIDIALMDIAGKALGVPCWKLLGDKVRDKVEVYADTDASGTDTMRAKMKRRMDLGFKHYKISLYIPDEVEGKTDGKNATNNSGKWLEVLGEKVKRMRDIIGYDVALGADTFDRAVRPKHPTVKQGIDLGNFMADSKYNLSYIEDVIHCTRFNSVNLNKQITEGSVTPTLNGEDIFGLEDFKPWIGQNAIDIIHPDLLTAGGMIETKKIADYAYLFGIKTMLHNASSPIGVMANVHTAATIKEFICLECHTMEMPWVDDLVTGIPKPVIQNGAISVPDSPGLGIEFIDEVAEKYLRENKYLVYKSGLFNPTPEFDNKITMMEAKRNGLIGDRQDHGGPWWHIGDGGKMEYTAGSK